MITVDYIGGGGSKKNSKNDYVIFEQPLIEHNKPAPPKYLDFEFGNMFLQMSVLYY